MEGMGEEGEAYVVHSNHEQTTASRFNVSASSFTNLEFLPTYPVITVHAKFNSSLFYLNFFQGTRRINEGKL